MNAYDATGTIGMNGNNELIVNGINLVELAERFGHYFMENITAICIVVVLIIGAMVYMQITHMRFASDITDSNNNLNVNNPNSRTVVIEAFESDSFDSLLKAGFCKSHLGKPAELETECSKLSRPTCMSTSCCTWAKMDSTESCVSGNKQGPIFNRNLDGSPKTLDYYYFENKCKGNCPAEK
jgi:hypothetical protein